MKKPSFVVTCLAAAAFTGWASLAHAQTPTIDFSSSTGTGISTSDVLIENVRLSVPVANPFDPTTTTTVTTQYNVTFRFNPVNLHLEPVGLSDAGSNCATAEVQVNNAVLGQTAPVAGATVTIGRQTITTNSAGTALFSGLPAGPVGVTVVAPDYVMVNQGALLQCESTNRLTLSMSPSTGTGALTANQFRVVLNWGENPRDLDSHLTGPAADGTTRWHVYYGNKQGGDVCGLDVDDTTSYGPETVTCPRDTTGSLRPGIYRYSVHHYSGSNTIGTSGATVRLELGNGQVYNYTPPDAAYTGSNNVWTVFEITVNTNGTIGLANVNTLTPSVSASSVRGGPAHTGGHSENPALFTNLSGK